MSKGMLALIGVISSIVIIYFLLGLGNNSTETQTITQNEVRVVPETTQIETDTPDKTEQELENELEKIEENADMELSEEIQ